MTDQLLQKVEEKIMTLLSELESSRNELSQLRQELTSLRADKQSHVSKLQGLVSLLDVLDYNDPQPVRLESTIQDEEAVLC